MRFYFNLLSVFSKRNYLRPKAYKAQQNNNQVILLFTSLPENVDRLPIKPTARSTIINICKQIYSWELGLFTRLVRLVRIFVHLCELRTCAAHYLLYVYKNPYVRKYVLRKYLFFDRWLFSYSNSNTLARSVRIVAKEG